MQLGENKISKIVYGLGYCKYGCFKKKKITYICTLDENNKPTRGFFDIYHPISSEARIKFEAAIYKALDEYKAETNK